MLSPSAFALELRAVAFVLGLERPFDSPTPIEALANGAAFLNPFLMHAPISGDKGWARTLSPDSWTGRYLQHRPLASLGPPYVYNFDPENATSLIAVAESACRLRFASYVPFAHRLETAAAAACSMMQHDALCACAMAGNSTSPEPTECDGGPIQSYP